MVKWNHALFTIKLVYRIVVKIKLYCLSALYVIVCDSIYMDMHIFIPYL